MDDIKIESLFLPIAVVNGCSGCRFCSHGGAFGHNPYNCCDLTNRRKIDRKIIESRSRPNWCPLATAPNNETKETSVSIAGGFVYGNYEQIKAVQQAIFDSEKLRRIKAGVNTHETK